MGLFGVPGIGGSVFALREGDIVLELLAALWRSKLCGTFETEDRRRRWEKDPPIEEEEEAEVGVKDARSKMVNQRVPRPSGASELRRCTAHHDSFASYLCFYFRSIPMGQTAAVDRKAQVKGIR
jgi:hypothetical protein